MTLLEAIKNRHSIRHYLSGALTDDAVKAIIEINRLENLGDAVFRRALGKLFRDVADPIEVIKWKDLYETMEETLDACEHLADTVRGVVVKNA